VFLCSHLTCLVQLLFLAKLSRPTYQQKLNKIMKISQEDVILIKIFIWQSSMVHGQHSVNCPTRVGNWEASTVCWRECARRVPLPDYQAALSKPRSARGIGGHRAQSGGQAKKASVSSLDFAWNCHSLFKCTQKNNSPWSPAQMLQTTSCSLVVWSQSHLSCHSLINNLIVCNKSSYCSVINRKLNKM